MMRGHVAFALAIAFTACGPSGDGNDHDDTKATLTIDPPTSELLIDNGVLPTQAFTATLTYPNGDTRDATSEVRFSVDSGYAMFADNTLTAHSAGKTQVFASFQDKSAVAQVIIRLRNVRVDPAAPPNAADWFSQLPDDPTRAPAIVYPPADVVMPRNLGDFEVHWTDTQNNVFEVSLKTEFADVRVIVPGGNGAIANSTWLAFLAAEWTSAVSNETTVQYQVRGVDANNPTSIGSTTPQIVKLSNEQMLGGVYYWAATAANNGPYGIFRHDMGKPGQPAEEFYTTAQTSGRCVACHVLSRDGTKMAITYDGGNRPATLLDVASKTPQPSTRGWNFGAFTPDGSKFLAVQNGTLTILDYATQQPVATMPASGPVTHPDLSADGTRLVYAQMPAGTVDWSFNGGKIFTRTFDPNTNTFGPEQLLVADTNNNYYPSLSPDGKWVLFNRSATQTAQITSYNNGDATLWVVKADGSGTPIELAKANQGLGLTNSWGRWAPFAQTIGSANEPMYWVTVSSTRDFGVRLVGTRRPQIWMTPFFPNKATSTVDPSNAAFRLPFQNIDSNNHIAQWTEQIVAPQ
jgi:hypothetical protein